ncbi:hypothetical protein RclHR1_02310004 [Rhizophagus clarus]|uniref:Uncharacterized protein n=1 Tax=Rhizophagus clarus TaxID=94130 RepID=A0A2Z6RQ45_9GLOM|nr:hypothetical protein RclHR1_02310004 [Rhizophagus clarus]GES73341.1 hypothetical protein GLOIN_2v1829849 [Rhizophagus clarus]
MAFQNQNQPPHKIFKTTQEQGKLFGGTPKQARKINKRTEPVKSTATTSKFSIGQSPSHISIGETIISNSLLEAHSGNDSQTHPSFLKISILNDPQEDDNGLSSGGARASVPLPSGDDADTVPGIPGSPEISGNDDNGIFLLSGGRNVPGPLPSGDGAGYSSSPGISGDGDGVSGSPEISYDNIPNSQMHDGRESTGPIILKISPILSDPQADNNGASLPRDGGDAPGPLPYSDGCPGVSCSSKISDCGISRKTVTTIYNSQMHDGREFSSKILSILNDPAGGGNAPETLLLGNNGCSGFPGPSGISGSDISPSNALTLIPNPDGEVFSSPTLSILNCPQILPSVPRELNNLINNNPNDTYDISLPPIRYNNPTSQQILLRTLESKPDHMEDLDSQMKSSFLVSLSFFLKNVE